MSWIRSPKARSLVGLLAAIGLLVAVTVGMRLGGFHPPPPVRLAIAIAASLPALWFVHNYWRNLDELAQEAQKWGWYWGGSLGLVLGFVAMTLGRDQLMALLPPGGAPSKLIVLGGMTVMLAQLVGFLLAWAIWWWRHR